MQYRFAEIDQLAELLEAEAAGRPFDTELANSLAQRLIQLCPDIARTMTLQIGRIGGPMAAA